MVKKNSLLDIIRDISRIPCSMTKRCLITKGPNAVEDGFHNKAHDSGPLRADRGPEKGKDKEEIRGKLSTQHRGESGNKMS